MIAGYLGGYAADLINVDFPKEVIHSTKRCILDTFAATICGAVHQPAQLMREALEEELGHGSSTLIPDGRKAPMRTAAMINGSAAHAMEVDDIFREGVYHPGPPVISAALAACQGLGRNGERFLRAVVAGYEISNRVAAAMQPAHYDFWHTTGTVGTVGSAAAVSVALGLNRAQSKHALANSVTMAAALQQAFATDSMGKPLHAGHAAEAGMTSAILAGKGMTGADGMFEGARGFGKAMGRNVDWHALVDSLETEYTICRMTQKNHTCCGHTFAAIDAVLMLAKAHELSPDDISEITVGTYAKGVEICGNPDPQTVYQAKFSIAYVISAALILGRVRFAAFKENLLHDSKMRATMAKVRCYVDEEAEAAFPNRRSAIVRIRTHANKAFKHHAVTRKGDPDNPLSDAELEEKFREFSAPVIGDSAVEKLRQAVWSIDVNENLRNIF